MKLKTILNRLVLEPLDIEKPGKIINIDPDKDHKIDDYKRVRIGKVICAGDGGMDFDKKGEYVRIPMSVKVGDICMFYQAAIVPIIKKLQDKFHLPYVYVISELDVLALLAPENKEDKRVLRIKE